MDSQITVAGSRGSGCPCLRAGIAALVCLLGLAPGVLVSGGCGVVRRVGSGPDGSPPPADADSHAGSDAGAEFDVDVDAPLGVEAHADVSADLSVVDSARDAGQTSAPAQLTLDQLNVSFGTVTVGLATPPTVFVIRNVGGAPSGALVVGVAGTGAGMFSAVTNACANMILVPGATCSLTASFAPKAPGAAMASLTISGVPGGTVAATLNGTGDFAVIVGGLDGALSTYPCAGASTTGYSCASANCTVGVASAPRTFVIGGGTNVLYDMTFRVRGIVEGYQYQGGVRDQGTTSQTASPDLFQRGGQPLSAGAVGYDYNTLELDVAPVPAGTPGAYFLNSLPVSAHDPSAVGLTFPVDFTKTIRIAGGGTVTLKSFDSDCRFIMNCGPTTGNTCAAPRTVSLAGASPPPPATFVQPFQVPVGTYGQWIFIDVTSVSVAP